MSRMPIPTTPPALVGWMVATLGAFVKVTSDSDSVSWEWKLTAAQYAAVAGKLQAKDKEQSTLPDWQVAREGFGLSRVGDGWLVVVTCSQSYWALPPEEMERHPLYQQHFGR